MRYIFHILICFVGFNLQAAEKVEFVANRIHSLMVFVNAVAGDPHKPPALKQIFEKSRFKTAESEKKLQILEKLGPDLGRYISFETLPQERKRGVSVEKIAWIQSAYARDLEDLQQRLTGVMGYDELTQFIDILKYFEPIHDELLWKPYKKELEKTAALLAQKSKTWNLDQMFDRAVKFYNAKWPVSQKFRISLFPVPPESNQSTAQSYGPFESVGVIMHEKDLEGRFGVIFHEMCHSLYDAQSAEFQHQISKWYIQNKSPYGKTTYGWINETLATILGNAWAYQKIVGKLDKASWYNQPTIDGFAKALYPEAVSYLEAGKTWNFEFVQKSIQVFQKTFPDSIKDLGQLLTNLSFVTDGSFGQTRGFSQQLRGLYRIQSMGSSSPINHSETLKELKEDLTSTVFILARWKNLKQFESLKSDYPQLIRYLEKAKKGQNVLGLFDIEGKKFLISLIKDELGYDFMLEKLKVLTKIEKLNEFVNLDNI